jgi:hypothetical protein
VLVHAWACDAESHMEERRAAAMTAPHTELGVNTMPKEIKNKREEKKKATLTPKEKKAAKRSKKESKRV